MTPSPSSTATPDCTHNIYLSTNPAGTLAFGVVQVGSSNSVTLPLTVTNNEPAGTLNLKAKIRYRDARDFAVTGGSCTTDKMLNAGATCTYELTLTGQAQDAGDAVSTDFMITGSFDRGVCPEGDFQRLSVTLAGAVAAAGARIPDSR
jgi:hypothetical protein